jgi:hypothetical protein
MHNARSCLYYHHWPQSPLHVLQHLKVLPYSIKNTQNRAWRIEPKLCMDRGCNTAYSCKVLCWTKLCAIRKNKTNRHMNRCGRGSRWTVHSTRLHADFIFFVSLCTNIYSTPNFHWLYISLHPVSIHIFLFIFSCIFWCVFLWWSTGVPQGARAPELPSVAPSLLPTPPTFHRCTFPGL